MQSRAVEASAAPVHRRFGLVSHAAVLALVAVAGCRDGAPVVVVHGDNGATPVRVELALSPPEQARGLMWRDRLDEDAGMLFVFRRARERSFWMKNTPLPLDIIYIAGDGKVVSVAESTTPYSQAPIPSHGPARYVLEVNAGFARAHGVHAGSRVEIPEIETDTKPGRSG